MAYPVEVREAVRDAWLLGETAASIAQRHGLHVRRVHEWARKYGWSETRKELRQKAQEKRTKTLAERKAKIDETYLALWQEIIDKVREALAAITTDTKSLAEVSVVVQRAQAGQQTAIGVDEELKLDEGRRRYADFSDDEIEEEMRIIAGRMSEQTGSGADRRASSEKARRAAGAS